ncbi:uncharacterized protein F5Z01DRAFT_126002 [Emericellopsis atlantica]|uniref:Uncharacterized protein n=1 Tax=Emericellopsis atlantica TaxID=2614577 RepID=A0A9P7ZKD1_9HYPO|nr:uncharacterized protein F5Z01DRAFT_126002 [Emericellopsis atlantica]KAG9253733.1 hypothetical protein F5Z01DRAFT_126002 [Emericellopsis atlantica]
MRIQRKKDDAMGWVATMDDGGCPRRAAFPNLGSNSDSHAEVLVTPQARISTSAMEGVAEHCQPWHFLPAGRPTTAHVNNGRLRHHISATASTSHTGELRAASRFRPSDQSKVRAPRRCISLLHSRAGRVWRRIERTPNSHDKAGPVVTCRWRTSPSADPGYSLAHPTIGCQRQFLRRQWAMITARCVTMQSRGVFRRAHLETARVGCPDRPGPGEQAEGDARGRRREMCPLI